MFACDPPFRMASSWQPNHSNLFSSPVPQPSMAYLRQLDSKPYNQNLSPPLIRAEIPVEMPDASQSSLEKTTPTYGIWKEDFPLIDFSIDDDMDRPRRGLFTDPADKAQMAQARKGNACIRCKMQQSRLTYLSVAPVNCVSNARNSAFPTPLIHAEFASPAKRSQTPESLTFHPFATRFRILDCSGKTMCPAWSGADDGNQWR